MSADTDADSTLNGMFACAVCGAAEAAPFLDAGTVPVQCTALYADRTAALRAPCGAMDLVLCRRCATVTNRSFDPQLVPYDGDYENSQLFSGTFRRYAVELAERLVADHELRGRPVVEVGCGKGEFLAMLATAGAGSATGYDPTYGGEVDHLDPTLGIRLVRTMFDETTVIERPSLVCSRHVLEHVVDPVGMLASIRSAVHVDRSCILYVEVPDAAFTFTPSGLWDLIYQHCSYFSAVSLERVARSAGFEVLDLRSVFGGQFLSLEARPSASPASVSDLDGEVERTVELLAGFAAAYPELVNRWRERISGWVAAGRRVALWGGGAKGVTFLNLIGASVDAVVDVNVRKQGRFLPGTGHRVLPPSALSDAPPDVVIVMNAAYEAEIRTSLSEIGLAPEVVLV